MEQKKADKAAFEKLRFDLWILCLHGLGALIFGASLTPMVALLYWVWKAMAAHALGFKLFVFSCSIGAGYFLFGATLLILCVAVRRVFGFSLKPGLHRIHAKETLHWLGYNMLVLLANSAFLDVLRLSPFQILFYRAMGAKVGRGVNVNTAGLADLELLEIGDNVLIGGGVALICHASERGFIRLGRTRIGNQVSIGIGSVVLPECQLGEGAVISPLSYVPRGTEVPPRGHWGGNPARDLKARPAQP